MRRNPRSGSGKPELESEWLVAETLTRKNLPKRVLEKVLEARQKAGPRRLGVLALTSHVTQDTLIIMGLQDFRDWTGWLRR